MILEQDRIVKVNIAEEMRSSYIDYSMSVIVSRALPDVRDGLKPVHRRILYSMLEQGNTSDKGYRKSARTVGDVMGKYHPHGDSSIYGALVRMAQDWAMRYTLVDGQGNFGSIDGDAPAAMRYTEARLEKMGEEMMQDLYKDTVDFQPNYDDKDTEPTVLSTRIPGLLVNGATGIAVGMATNMPTHNLGEVIDGCVAYIDNPDITVEELMHFVKAPDFPTGAYIYGLSGVREAYETGRGRIVMRAKTEIEVTPTHEKIVVTEIPYNVNKREINRLMRTYVRGMMQQYPDSNFFPDANLTLRVAYGHVQGFQPKDAVYYKPYSTLEGIMEKENPDIYDYVVEPRLKELYNNRDYGRYANANGEMPVGFIATNHTTGGNSGSPVLNADGQLIGINFDRCWEGTMSDLLFDPDYCRNISLDIRYCLFIIDKFAGATHLIDEMTIVE